jgi:GT2 family glycosyltransferase
LNNDTTTTEGWLKAMMDISESDPLIGIVNPSSNNLGQRPDKDEPVELYAERISKGNRGKFVELGAAIGFCMLIKRSVIKKIGMFDEVYGMGNFEDTDFSRRAVQEGYKCVRACGAYVYHRESSSFNKVGTFDEDFKRNKEIYEFRWGKPKRVAYILDSYDANILRRLEIESLRLARNGDWVWYYVREPMNIPPHSNIQTVEFKPKDFYAGTIFKILTKKKRYSAIYVGTSRLGKILEVLSFIHKAKVGYY